MTRYLVFWAGNGYAQQKLMGDPTPFEDVGLDESHNSISSADLPEADFNSLDEQAQDFLYSTDFAPECGWFECNADGEPLNADDADLFG